MLPRTNVARCTFSNITSATTSESNIDQTAPTHTQHKNPISKNIILTMGSNQSKPISEPTSVSNTMNSNDGITSSSTKEANAKLPSNHPKVEGTGGECPYKNPVKSISNYFGRKKQADVSKETSSLKSEESPSPSSSPSSSGCPVKSNSTNNSASSSACPVKSNSSQVQYNVYSQPIDPTNNMPSVANQVPAPMQNEELSTERVKSSIPKGGTDAGTWTYPSPQMFYNSLARKNKLGDTEESDIESVVAIHNNMNEKTWAKVMEWEEVLCPEGMKHGGSKLLKFLGRPSDLSPKARFKNMVFGHPLPFDRHDWTVVRPDGTEVRYVIDYYVDETKADEKENSGMPNMHDRDAIKSILVDVRPAVETIESVVGRAATMPFSRRFGDAKFEPMPIIPNDALKQQITESEKVWDNIQRSVEQSKNPKETKSMILKQDDIPDEQKENTTDNVKVDISDDEAREISKSFLSMLDKCKTAQQVVEKCKDDAECAKASLALTMCLANVVCPVQQKAVAIALNADDFDPEDEKAAEAYNTRFEKALENMTICVTAKSQQAAMAREKYPDLFKDMK